MEDIKDIFLSTAATKKHCDDEDCEKCAKEDKKSKRKAHDDYDDEDRENETDAFLGIGDPKNPHELGKTSSEAKSKAKYWTKRADKLHDKIHSDSVKKAKSTKKPPGHVEHDAAVVKHMKNHPEHENLQKLKKNGKEHREHYKQKFSGAPMSHRYYIV